jgi:hypothetical protein
MDWLKKLLLKHGVSEELVTTILGDTKDSQYVPKHRLDEEIDKRKNLETEISNRDTQIKDLEKATKGNDELTKKIDELSKSNDDWQAKYKATQIDTAIKLAAKDAKDPADVLAFIKKDVLELNEDGTIKGLDDALKGLRESKPYLFGETQAPGLKGKQPNNLGGGDPKGITKEQFKMMGYTDRAKLYNENPDLYNQLSS